MCAERVHAAAHRGALRERERGDAADGARRGRELPGEGACGERSLFTVHLTQVARVSCAL